MLQKFVNWRSNVVYHIITGDETWIYSYNPEKITRGLKYQGVFECDDRATKLGQARSWQEKYCLFFSPYVSTVPLEKQRTVNAEW